MKVGLSSSASAAPRRIRKVEASSGRIVACATRLPSGPRCARPAEWFDKSSGAPTKGPAKKIHFSNSEGGFASKSAAARTLKKLLVPDGQGEIDGHSMRRCGAQMLTAPGVEPWLVEWFGRWGSAAIRTYIEDARARAPNVSQLALRVANPEAGTAWGCSGQAPPTPSMPQVASLGVDRCAGARER